MIPMIDESIKDKVARLLPEKLNQQCLDKLRSSRPTDYINLTTKEDHFLIELWEKGMTGVTIPSDLFFARTVPLMDCVIAVDESDIGGVTSKYRVMIFDEYKEILDALKNENTTSAACVGIVSTLIDKAVVPQDGVVKIFDAPLFIPILVQYGADSLLFGGIGSNDMKFLEYAKPTNGVISQWFISMMETWYGIQIALLHPAVKDVFKYPQITKDSEALPKKKQYKRKVKYIRKHYLTVDKLEAVSKSHEARKYDRKCLAWYVIGHWRTYKDGKKTFVMPYWKGVLRNVKQSADSDIREREIDFSWETSSSKNKDNKETSA